MTLRASGVLIVRDVRLLTRRRGAHHMVMPAGSREWTVEEVRALPDDGQRYELIDGELLVTPAPRLVHQEAVATLLIRLRPYLAGTSLGHALASPADITLSPRSLVQPDVFVMPLVEGRRPRQWTDVSALLLAIEVLSPTTARADRTIKRRYFQRNRVPEYWIVDLDARLVERWRPEDVRPELLDDALVWQPDPLIAPLSLDLRAFFDEAIGPTDSDALS